MKGTFWIKYVTAFIIAVLAFAIIPSAAADGNEFSAGASCSANYVDNEIITDGIINAGEWAGAEVLNVDMNGIDITLYLAFNNAALFIGAEMPDDTEDAEERFAVCIDVLSENNGDVPGVEDIKLDIPRGGKSKAMVGNNEYWVLSSERIYSIGRATTSTGWSIETAIPLDRLNIESSGPSEYRLFFRIEDTGSGYSSWPGASVTTDLNTYGQLIIDMDDVTYYSGSMLNEEDNDAANLYGLQSAIIVVALAFVAVVVILFTYNKAQ